MNHNLTASCAAIFLFFVVVLAYGGLHLFHVHSTLSRTTYGDVLEYQQAVHSFWSGRLFQTSMRPANVHPGDMMPPYHHTGSVHITPAYCVLTFLYPLVPRIETLYACGFFYTVIGLFLFAWFYPRACSVGELSLWGYGAAKCFFASAVFLLTIAFSPVWQYLVFNHAHPRTYVIFLLLLAHLFYRQGRLPLVFLCCAAMPWLQEDCGMVAIGYTTYLLFIERDRRHWILVTFAFALVSTGFLLGYWNPRLCMRGDEGTAMDLIEKLNWYEHLMRMSFFSSFRTEYTAAFSGFLAILGMLGLGRLLDSRRVFFLAITPFAYYGTLLLAKTNTNHATPIFAAFCIVFLESLVEAVHNPEHLRQLPLWRKIVCIGLLLIVAINFGSVGYRCIQNVFYALGPQREKMITNWNFIHTVQRLPAESKLCVWGNEKVMGHLAARCDIWMFPSFFDQTDFLAIQKNAWEVTADLAKTSYDETEWREISLIRLPDEKQALLLSIEKKKPIQSQSIGIVRELLVDRRKTHTVYLETGEHLILKRTEPSPISPDPRSSSFWGW